MLEVHLQTPIPEDALESQKLFNALDANFGWAGDMFLQYVVPNLRTECTDTFNYVRDRVYRRRRWGQTERFALNTVICTLAAGMITNYLELTNFDIPRLTKKAIGLVISNTLEMESTATRATETFAAFLNKHINSLLIVNDKVRILQETPVRIPFHSLLARYEPDTLTLYIAQKEFNKWCAEQFINSREMRAMFKAETGEELIVTKKRMGKGWNADFGPVSAYEIKDATYVLGIELDMLLEMDDGVAPAQIS
jgi:hypothetical protein